MLFIRTNLEGAWLIEPEPIDDHRGIFARTFCVREFARKGLVANFVQHSFSRSTRRGTLRGMHFQRAPDTEVKLVTCSRGAIWDIIIDLRPGSPTYLAWQGFEMTPESSRRLYVPEGFAHGFQTLLDDSEVGYLISAFHAPASASGVRYDDPTFAIDWPLPVAALSEKDRTWPPFAPEVLADQAQSELAPLAWTVA